MVVSDKERRSQLRFMSVKETSASEPFLTYRKRHQTISKLGFGKCSGNKIQGIPAYCLSDIRYEDGVTLIQALVWNVGKLFLWC